jgi:hypothetical protein
MASGRLGRRRVSECFSPSDVSVGAPWVIVAGAAIVEVEPVSQGVAVHEGLDQVGLVVLAGQARLRGVLARTRSGRRGSIAMDQYLKPTGGAPRPAIARLGW